MSWGTLAGEQKVDTEIEAKPRAHPRGMRFQGVNALVTGAGRGFGSLIATALADEGANVVVAYNTSKDGAEKLAQQIRSTGRKSMTAKVDITKWPEVKSMTEKVWNEFGPIDLLVNNSGDVSNKQMSWRQITEEAIDQTLAVDIKGTLFMLHEVGSKMLERKSGTIVNVASNVIVTGSPRAPQYAASKYGVIGLTKSYALAFSPWVRVNAACPGYMDTAATTSRADWTPQRRKWIVDHTALKRIGKPEHIVPVVLFLASDDSIHMTGNIVIADGGFSMPGA
ncbi:MAG TPA: SDR family oxidoreductase [Nitrososphaerales archaeon]|nr:SDR family oxidoreductase [Nitrososphaerales archaeon]